LVRNMLDSTRYAIGSVADVTIDEFIRRSTP
jgi:hypothetical protein